MLKILKFLHPLPLIDFSVSIVNPRNDESVIDPTVGIADFLAASYVNSNSKLNDNNIFGFDKDNTLLELVSNLNARGNWDNRADDKELKKSYYRMLSIWGLYKKKDDSVRIDLGVVFLENENLLQDFYLLDGYAFSSNIFTSNNTLSFIQISNVH